MTCECTPYFIPFDSHLIYSERIDEFKYPPDDHSFQPRIEILCLEENTRDSSRPSCRPSPLHPAKEPLLENLYTPTSALVHAIMESSPITTEHIAIRE